MSNLFGGKHFQSLVHRHRTKKQLKSTVSRFNRDLNKLKDPYESGIFSRPQDLAYERPSKTEPENIFLYAANDDDEIITLHLHWTPNPDENCGLIRVNLKLIGFQNGVTYQFKQSRMVYNLDKFDDYTVGGFKLEIFSPLKRIKLRLNDFCLTVKENTDQEQTYDQNDYKYIRLIAIVLPVQEVYDHLSTFDSKFASSQLTSLSQRFPQIDLVDIGSHVKFCAQIDGQSAVETDLWGFRGKLRLSQPKPSQLIKFSGYALKKGYNFSVTFFELDGSWFVNGFVGWGSALIFPVTATTATRDLFIKDTFSFTIENKYRKFNVTGNKRANAIYSIKIDNCTGVGLYIKLPFTGNEAVFDSKILDFGAHICSIPSIEEANDLTVPLNQTLAINSQLTGGKGSSLSKLTSILVDYPKLGQVPLGVVVTTKAYHLMSQTIDLASIINKLKHTISSSNQDMVKLEAECCSLVDKIGSYNLPEPIREAINTSLTESFGSNWINDKKFAIRSSAYGEDSDELSCAGQMATFLGVSSLDQIFKCVMECWASQFRFIAIRYKLMNGLDLDLDMAVVIQEMIDCDQAGVLFTCDPVVSDPLSVLITANHGLGESIVSSISDPDTIKVKLEMSPNGLTIDSIQDIQIGGKGRIIKLSETGDGTITIDSQSKSSSCCLNENQIIDLTSTCLKVASFFNGPCDIEWGIQSNQIYLFQCRPVTTFSSSVDLNEWELSHELDSPHVSSNEYHTRANLGEVYPGVASYICSDYQIPSSTIAFVKKFFLNRKNFKFMPYITRGFIINCHHCFFSMKDGTLFVYDTPPEKENKISTSMEYSLLGQIVDDREMKTDSYERIGQFFPQSKWEKLKSTVGLIFMGSRRLAAVTLDEFPSKVTDKSSSNEMFLEIVNNSDYLWNIFLAHLGVTIGSSVMNFLAISILTSTDKNSPSILPDFSKLLASCEQVVSAQIPVIIKELASKVTDEEERKLILNGTTKEISDYLNSGTSQLAINYRQFIKDYGHRGWKEFDWSGKVWRKDPSFIINPLKALVQQSDYKAANPGKTVMTDEELIASLKTPLSKVSKFLLKKFILPWCRNYVSLREEGKNKLVWKIDQMRKLFDRMVNTLAYKEHRLPDPALAYYLTPDELLRLTLSSNPGLVLLAKRRLKICQKLDSYEFPIINIGPKILPNNLPAEEIYTKDWNNYNGQEIIGTPISQGQIKSTAYVARKIEEAANIKPGDILITYSTDVGWCPFFPLIGGLITEIGGLISHGAVIAREFGLPCIVGVPNACKIFKSGDKISMDASKGVIVKLID